MRKKIVFLITLILLVNTANICIAADKKDRKSRGDDKQQEEVKSSSVELDKDTMYYPNANMKSAVSKYKVGNYVGCLQELFSLVKKEPSNAVAYYYMAMAYTHIDMQSEAVEAYEKVMAIKPNSYIAEYAEKGRDCLTDGPKCSTKEEVDELDTFINSPYGNGLSNELNEQVKQKQLNSIKETINKKENLEHDDIQKIRDFDIKRNNDTSFIVMPERIAMVSDEEILNAVKTLKEAGLNLTVQQDNPYSQYSQYQDPRVAEMSMMLGGNNNYNNNNMMNMLPMLMNKAQNGENIDPRFMQAMMMNSMMSDLDFGNNNNNRY